mgnify:CR=1 FL=1
MTFGLKSEPRVSIIMRSKNSDWVIDRALAALFSQSFTDFELIVVDSGSTDRTLEIVRGYPCRLIEIEAGDYFPGAVLNSAIGKTSGELVVFQNSDSVPLSQHSLARLVEAFDDERVQAAFGRQIPRPEAEDWVRRDYEASFPESGPAPPWLTLSLPLAGFRRSAWERHPFYEDSWASEDTEWGNWANKNNVCVEYVPEAITMHSHNYTLKQIYGRRFVEGEADAFIYGGADQLAKMFKRVVTSSLRDMRYEIRNRHWMNLWKTPFRRGVYQWAYYTGRRHGARRAMTSDVDVATGQQVVLSRYQ